MKTVQHLSKIVMMKTEADEKAVDESIVASWLT
jgi:hypothetical protein